jgi:hypothetical protein
MKRTILAVSLMAVTAAASAAPSLSWNELSQQATIGAPGTFNGFNPNSGLLYFGTAETGSSTAMMSIGTVSVSEAAHVTYTYLGTEAGYKNLFYSASPYNPLSAEFVTKSTPLLPLTPPASVVGNTVMQLNVAAGLLDFGFEGLSPNQALNNAANSWAAGTSIGLIGRNMTLGSQTYSFVIGYNDTASHSDWDDLVIGINVAAIPEPETYAMLLAGLGLMGFVARRRKQSVSAS